MVTSITQKHFVGYIRVSSERQAKEDLSELSAQRENSLIFSVNEALKPDGVNTKRGGLGLRLSTKAT